MKKSVLTKYYFRRILQHICCNLVQKNSKLQMVGKIWEICESCNWQVNVKKRARREKDFSPYYK